MVPAKALELNMVEMAYRTRLRAVSPKQYLDLARESIKMLVTLSITKVKSNLLANI